MKKKRELDMTIEKHYGPEIRKAINAGLSLTATLAIKNRPQCNSLIYVGPSGSGKSVAVESLYDVDEKYFHRVDDFTPPAFVSHSANKTLEELKEIDLLPKLQNKVMGTKELSPIFNGDEKDMLKNFSVLTAVLDGHGFYTHKGTHGGRGYKGDYRFNWLGATTEFPDRTYHLMGRLGNRLLFWEMGTQPATEGELLEFSKNFKGDDAIRTVCKLVKNFLADFFKSHPVNSVNIEEIKIADYIHRHIVRYANLLTHARAITQTERNFSLCQDEFLTAQAEGPHRIIISLRMIVCGSALMHGRSEVTDEDLKLVPHIVLSSVPVMRRRMLQSIATQGELSKSTIKEQLGWSDYIADKYMREFSSTGIVEYTKGVSKTNTPSKIKLAQNYGWLLRGLLGGSKNTFVDENDTAPTNCRGVRGLGKVNNTRSTPKYLEGGNGTPKKIIALYNECDLAVEGQSSTLIPSSYCENESVIGVQK